MIMITRGFKCFSKYLHCRTQHYLINDRVISTIRTQSNSRNEKHIVWLDMEMTGLDVEKCRILEIACLITDEHLMLVSDRLNLVIHQPNEILENMSNWCKIQHKKTGLISDCQSSKITLEEAQERTLQYLENNVPRRMCPLAGNSVYMDRMFLRRYMPLVDDYLHHRNIDISAIKELARRWHSSLYKEVPKKNYDHRAMSDIMDSLNELRYYKEHLFVGKK